MSSLNSYPISRIFINSGLSLEFRQQKTASVGGVGTGVKIGGEGFRLPAFP